MGEPSAADPDVARLAALPVAVLGDVLDRLGRRSQAMEHAVRPLDPGASSVAGRAFTIAAAPSDELLENPYERELAAVDATPAGSVVVLATGGSLDVAVWGELLTTRMLARGGVGVVTDGGIRDVARIRRLGAPAFAAAITPRDSFGRALVTSFGEPVTCAGVDVALGDLVRGDEDGVVVVPAELAADALAAAEGKHGLERIVREGLERGETAAELYDRYGVL
ncbi:MAG TPA: RraA family protein [Gaiellaceae bacterium]|jgi:regulator of RNase E activity RraA